jgi:hypothetical protein
MHEDVIYKTIADDRNGSRELFFKYKHQDEELGIATLLKSDIVLHEGGFFNQAIKNWFRRGIIQSAEQLQSKGTASWRLYGEEYTKAVWLTKIFLTEGFKYYMGAHFSPRIRKWHIHPGGNRFRVWCLFDNKKDHDFLVFNNSGHDINFKLTFKSIEELEDYVKEPASVALVADHGSLIPHIHFGQKELHDTTAKKHEELRNFWNWHSIECNIPGWDRKAMHEKSTINISVQNPNDVQKALLIAPSFKSWNKDGIKIERT